MTVELFGEIVSDDWAWLYELFGIPCCCPKQVRDAIKKLPEGEELICFLLRSDIPTMTSIKSFK